MHAHSVVSDIVMNVENCKDQNLQIAPQQLARQHFDNLSMAMVGNFEHNVGNHIVFDSDLEVQHVGMVVIENVMKTPDHDPSISSSSSVLSYYSVHQTMGTNR